MSRFFLACFLVGVVVVVELTGPTIAHTHHADKSRWTPLICGSKGYYIVSEQEKNEVEKCEKGSCVFKCQATAGGLVNPDGTTSFDIFEDYIESVVPKQYQETSKEHVQECFRKYGDHIDPKDEQCVMSNKFVDCLWAVFSFLKCTP